jgi:hypothetical protein
MLSDPQSITVNAVAQSLPAVSRSANSSTYQKDDATYKLGISHSYGKTRTRRVVRVDAKKISADPLVAAQNLEYKFVAYLVIDEPITGYSVTERKDIIVAIADWLKASTNANTIAVLGGQS